MDLIRTPTQPAVTPMNYQHPEWVKLQQQCMILEEQRDQANDKVAKLKTEVVALRAESDRYYKEWMTLRDRVARVIDEFKDLTVPHE